MQIIGAILTIIMIVFVVGAPENMDPDYLHALAAATGDEVVIRDRSGAPG